MRFFTKERIQLICGIYTWVNYNELTTSSLGMVISRGDYPQMTLIQVSEWDIWDIYPVN